ncbi:MAG TPA: pyridoxal-dependent decarboxylase [Gemmatimonadales bacterium]|jgi:aromatic-L-amino-acid decarboxylase|nr:pyridoxal-dependent decarboxylase [Gemmatimonadales bacterium]
MHPDEFRRQAHVLVDWMADYLRDVGTLPVTPAVLPGDIKSQLPTSPPESGEPFEALIEDFRRVVVPGMTHWNHPGWFAYFPGNNSPPSILGEMLTAAMGAQCMSWATSPAATELEQVVMDWLRQMLALPADFTGVIQDTASTATLVALLTARERATDGRAGGLGLARSGSSLTVYASAEAHSSIDKAVKLAGYGLDQLRHIPTDEAFALRPEALEQAILEDRSAGRVPACVVASIGTTSSTAIDPVPAIAEICRRHGLWLHVDAAYAGAAAIVPELRWMFQGVGQADSFVFNPHKWLLTNFDCTAYFVRDPDALLGTFQATPEYLRTTHDSSVVNYRDWGIQLGRRFRALKLWFVIRSYGVAGLQAMIRRHVALAQEFAGWVASAPDFEVVAPVPLGLVCFRYRPAGRTMSEIDALNQELLARINAGRTIHLTHTRLRGRYVIRLVVGQRGTTREHVVAAWELIRASAATL